MRKDAQKQRHLRPLAFPLLVERLNNRMSNESVLERVQRMRQEAERREG